MNFLKDFFWNSIRNLIWDCSKNNFKVSSQFEDFSDIPPNFPKEIPPKNLTKINSEYAPWILPELSPGIGSKIYPEISTRNSKQIILNSRTISKKSSKYSSRDSKSNPSRAFCRSFCKDSCRNSYSDFSIFQKSYRWCSSDSSRNCLMKFFCLIEFFLLRNCLVVFCIFFRISTGLLHSSMIFLDISARISSFKDFLSISFDNTCRDSFRSFLTDSFQKFSRDSFWNSSRYSSMYLQELLQVLLQGFYQ